jgi:glucose-6-phosphate isomerase
MGSMSAIEKTPEWRALAAHHRIVRETAMRDLFAADSERARRLSLRVGDLLLDYSKNRITDETLRLLHDLARAADVKGWAERLFSGAAVNTSENRPALHTALRQRGGSVSVGGRDVMAEIAAVRARMKEFVTAVRGGNWDLHTDTRVSDVVHIGIGGSDLGPRMVVQALRPRSVPLRVHFVSSLDDAELSATLDGLIPASTLFIVASKSFTTPETLANATAARDWLLSSLKEQKLVGRHFVAVTSKPDVARQFGIDDAQIFPMWDWVGGRYSLWSAIGLPIGLAVGWAEFERLLDGAAAMDEHFRSAPLERNLPVTLALLGIWYANFFGAETHAVLPYDWKLRLLPAWLQQVDMESNGKSVDREGRPANVATSPIVWGGSGSDGQHAFFQLLHQGTRLVPADFLIAAEGGPQRDKLIANALAQSEALMLGRETAGERHRAMPGNRPSNTILFRRLDAATLGSLLALYEHKIFVQGVIWGINSFDQWGVELGKMLAARIEPELGTGTASHDGSTNGLIETYRAWRR